ncbi:MAG TPA: hypothetical protein PKA21_16510 [Kiritimatiellia bacterium]|nr:hypothetical protein [Kiritimatiellia bacterium]
MNEEGPCVRCGEATDTRLGEVWICPACYEVRSSCCPEFGPDDLAAGIMEDGNEPKSENKP